MISGRLTLTVTSTREPTDKCNTPSTANTRYFAGRRDPEMSLRKDENTAGIALLDPKTNCTTFTTTPQVQLVTSLQTKLQGFPWRVFFISFLLPLSLAPIIILSAIAEMASQNYIRGRSCYPNGLWKEAAGATWRIMDSTYFFTPNLSFGNMTFTQVKVIDIAWDLLVGRGGQMGLAWVNWVVFNEWLVFHLERWGTSYKMYSAVALQTTSWTMLGVASKELLCFGEKSWARFFRWLGVFSMLISTLYVLAFPTLMAAMTGYITTYVPYVEDRNQDLKEWSKVDEIVRTISSGGLALGFEQEALYVTAKDEELVRTVDDCKCHHWSNLSCCRERRMQQRHGNIQQGVYLYATYTKIGTDHLLILERSRFCVRLFLQYESQ